MRKMISDDVAAKLAYLWAEPIHEGRLPLSWRALHQKVKSTELQKALGISFGDKYPTERTMERAVMGALRQGLVRVQRDEAWHIPEESENLASQLRNKFRDNSVEHYIVCQTDDIAKDQRSTAVGRFAGKYLLERTTFFKSKDRIGVGSGRAVQGLAQSMLRHKRLEIEDVELFAMAGQTLPSLYPHRTLELFNADQNVTSIANYFSRGARAQLMAGHLAYDNIAGAKQNRWLVHLDGIDSNFIGRDNADEFDTKPTPPFWDGEVTIEERSKLPNTAIVGVGSLEPGHILYQLIKGEKSGISAEQAAKYLSPIAKALSEIIEMSDLLRDRYHYSPVGEVCNRFYLTDCPNGLSESAEVKRLRKAIHAQLGEITETKILCTPKRLYSLVDRLAVVAGGDEKSFAIKTLICHPMVKVSYLFIDSQTAERLLDD